MTDNVGIQSGPQAADRPQKGGRLLAEYVPHSSQPLPDRQLSACLIAPSHNGLSGQYRQPRKADWGAPKLPDSPSNRMDVWKG
jgi:hypothetical protein